MAGRWILALALAASVAACAARAPGEGPVVVATEAGYPPFEFQDASGTIVGFDVDLVRAVAREAGFEVEFLNQQFDGIIPGLKAGRYDMAVSAMTITAERAEQVDFSDPYYDAGQIISVRADEEGIRTLDDLKGRVVAVQLNTTGHMTAQKVEGAEIRTFESIEPAFLELLQGRADAVVNDFPTTNLIVAKKEGLKTVGSVLTEERYGIAVKKGNADLLVRINEGLRRVRASGEYERIRKKWMGD